MSNKSNNKKDPSRSGQSKKQDEKFMQSNSTLDISNLEECRFIFSCFDFISRQHQRQSLTLNDNPCVILIKRRHNQNTITFLINIEEQCYF